MRRRLPVESEGLRVSSAVIFPEFANEFGAMLAELEASPLVVVLAPSKRAENPWDMIRVASSVPPPWYRALGRMAGGFPSASLYAGDLLRIASSRLRQPARRAAA